MCFCYNRLNHSQDLSRFIRIYQNLAFKYSRITPANYTLEMTCKCTIFSLAKMTVILYGNPTPLTITDESWASLISKNNYAKNQKASHIG